MAGEEAQMFAEAMKEISEELHMPMEPGTAQWEFAIKVWERCWAYVYDAAYEGAAEMRREDAAILLGREGGKKGGPARARRLSPERRSEVARAAAQARWARR
jgi:hypothetical protein